MTDQDYKETKRILQKLNEQFYGAVSKGGAVPTDEKEDVKESLKVDMYTDGSVSAGHQRAMHTQTHFKMKGLTVGSLKK